MNGLYRQLGFFPDNLEADAVEVSWRTDRETMLELHPELKRFGLIQNSDAHFMEDIGSAGCWLEMKERSFAEFGLALRGEHGRKVTI